MEERYVVQEEACRKSCSRVGWSLTLYLLVGLVLKTAVQWLVGRFAPELLFRPLFQWSASVIISYGIAFPVFARLIRGVPAFRPEERRPEGLLGAVQTYFAALCAVYGGNFITILLLGPNTGNPVTELMSLPAPLTLILTCILAPACEELMFRGLVLSRLRPYGERFAVLGSALLFGLLHGNLAQFFYAAAFGVVMGGFMVRTNCLWQCIAIHAMVNFISSGLLPLFSGWGELGAGILGVLLMGGVLFGGIVLAAHWRACGLPPDEGRPWRCFFRNLGMASFCAAFLVLSISWLRTG